jgi:hypothetical protein
MVTIDEVVGQRRDNARDRLDVRAQVAVAINEKGS